MKLSELLNKFFNFPISLMDEENNCILWIHPYLSGVSSWVSSWLCYLSDNSDIWPVTRSALQVSRVPVLHVTSRHITASRPDWDWDRLRVTGPGFCETCERHLPGQPDWEDPALTRTSLVSNLRVSRLSIHRWDFIKRNILERVCVGF